MAQIVGGAVGAVIGFVATAGNPAGAKWGWAIGSAIGNSFTTVRQPRIGELAEVRAGEGGPRARVYGTFRPIGGQVVWAGKPREIRTRQRQGKGGPRVETSTILRSYAIGICEGPISGVSRIWRNNELVYDVRPGSPILAESTKWLQGKTILLGGWAQLPHPTMEAALGAGNAPHMRGTAYLVVTDEDLTELRGAIPAYQFEVRRGVGRVVTSTPYPVEVIEGLLSSGAVQGGTLYAGWVEGLSSTGAVLGGELRNILQSYTLQPEGLSSTGAVLGGELRTLLVSYNNYPPEGLTSTGAVLGGELRTLLISYNNYPPEGLFSTGAVLGGTLS